MPDTRYTHSQLASAFGITTPSSRFHDDKGLIRPRREGQTRLFTAADRVRIKLILRGKRIGMTLQECVDFIDMYDPEHNNEEQLHSLVNDVKERRQRLLQQKKDIDDMLAGLDEVQGLCEASLANNHTNLSQDNR